MDSVISNHALPPIAGFETEILELVQRAGPRGPGGLPPSNLNLAQLRSGFACALHMHQPTIPAGANGELISHLQYMLEHQGEGDNHNAESFAHCYKRLAEIIPQLIEEGCNPRIMLDYSGNLLWGLGQMGRHDIIEALQTLACDPALQPHVEWLGTFWSHAVAPSTPIPDLKLQILAWQHQFAALFGREALQRVKGFSPPEMHLPNHPDTLYALVKALNDCGYRWLLVQEHSVENLDGSGLRREQTFIPNQLVARSSSGETASLIALIKTQGSDTKLVGQMQPYHEALGLGRQPLGATTIPALVSQIADGENGGVMMNEFPPAFLQAHRSIAARGQDPGTVAINGSEYLALLDAAGVSSEEFPKIQAVGQHRLWQRLEPLGGPATAEATEAAISDLQARDPSFSMTGASWTNDLSWVEGYANVLEPMAGLSARFHQVFDPLVASDPLITKTPPYQQALLHLLLLETSCFRYWGQGTWTDYAREIHRRGEAAIASFASLSSARSRSDPGRCSKSQP
ncbi:glycosyl hydrolase family 57 [Synechococcus sp. CS-1329]|uniref:glycosyl hydrolase family 57 n=1 Tax=Synechococcus sp. CS-1329 TaxID=2847975 RepID=UPI00223BF617|nr:glycosyl hydrolase family 57 [Synechococcus sp. CS-1329]MCT0218328.1 glycosyl hydrolase family 57 [Synechococcus sp. CS-1329]